MALAAARRRAARGARVVGIGDEAALAGLAAESGLSWCAVGPEASARPAPPWPPQPCRCWSPRRARPGARRRAVGAAAAASLARRRDAFLAAGGAPEELARRLGRTIPLVYGAERRGRRGGALVEVAGQPQRQGACLRGGAAGADP